MVHGHSCVENDLDGLYTCALSSFFHMYTHVHSCILASIACPGPVRILTWNIKGDTGRGWAEARKAIIPPNIQGNDMVFLQEVQWAEKGTKDLLATPAGYELVMTRSNTPGSNVCILYNPRKLIPEDNAHVTQIVLTVMGWTNEDSQRVCLQVFTLQGKGEASRFAAIGVHAPRDVRAENDRPDEHRKNERFCKLLKIVIEKISEVYRPHALPILIAGDFNSDIKHWNSYRFLVPEYETDRNPIDFIALKITKVNHLEIAEVTEKQYHDILIPQEAQDLLVKKDDAMRTVRICCENLYLFYKYLCGSHRPLSAEVTYSEAIIPASGTISQEDVAKLDARVEELEREMAMLKVENSELQRKVGDLQRE